MRVLWTKAGKLLPVDTGGKIRSYNLLQHLAEWHELTVLSYYGERRDLEYEREIEDRFPGAETVWTGAPDASVLHYARHILSPAPYAVTKFTSPGVRRLIGGWMAERRFDVAVCDFLSASLNFPPGAAHPVRAVPAQRGIGAVAQAGRARAERAEASRIFDRGAQDGAIRTGRRSRDSPT